MRSGLPGHNFTFPYVAVFYLFQIRIISQSNMFAHTDSIATPSEIVANKRHLHPSAELGKAWHYDNMGYIALSHIISTLTDIPFHKYVDQNMVKPLGMGATSNATQLKQSYLE